MKVQELIALLETMPPEAHVSVTSEGMATGPAKGSFREGQKDGPWIVNGFTAEEILAEEIDAALFEDAGIVILHLTTNSSGGLVE